jgi:hypothetical protein
MLLSGPCTYLEEHVCRLECAWSRTADELSGRKVCCSNGDSHQEIPIVCGRRMDEMHTVRDE